MKIEIRPSAVPPQAMLLALGEKARTEYSDIKMLFHVVCLDTFWWCGVVGDGENAAYEWFVWRQGKLTTSNCGYGCTEVALKEVLNQEVK